MLKQVFDVLVTVGTWVLLPVIGLCLYDKFFQEPKRPTDEDGEPLSAPHVFGFAYQILPFAILAAMVRIGLPTVVGWWSALVTPLSYLALPLILLSLYDIWILAPQRPRAPSGQPGRAPWYIRYAKVLAIVALFAVVVRIGVSVVFDWVKQVATPLSYFALPVGLWCAVDSWFLAPRRQIAAGVVDAPVPPITRAAYFVLPVLVVALIVRMITAETLDFSLVLLELSLATGLVWVIDHFFVRKHRLGVKLKDAGGEVSVPEPGTVDYARSFFPVAFIVLLVRAFIFEPFRIPSDSMMPTLLDGDFIVVNKYSYGLRWPVINQKFLGTGSPQRGDVVVFRYPPDPNVNYIKRLVGLPGDRIEVRDDHLVINGETISLVDAGRFNDGCYDDFRLSVETLGEHTHQVMSCRSPHGWLTPGNSQYFGVESPRMSCDRKEVVRKVGGYVCRETPPESGEDSNNYVFQIVPAGHYIMIGDNRDNSEDSRSWGMVPDENLVGKATRIWFNFDSQRPSAKIVNMDRIGQKIE
jgi:signal peptidase I